jgi:hypothetical protein
MKRHLHPSDLQALSRLGISAVVGVTEIVESVHHAVVRVAPPLGRVPAGRTRGITGFVYRRVHGVTRAVGLGLEAAFAVVLPLLEREKAPRPSSAQREAVLAALNGVLGDHLADTGNALATPMQLFCAGRPLQLPMSADDPIEPSGRLLLFIHGLCMNDTQWRERALAAAGVQAADAAADPWVTMARALGFTPLHLRYNSGRAVATNGRELARLLEVVVRDWPVPVTDIAIVGHSMGGLVARSACHFAANSEGGASAAQGGWLARLRALVFLGTPHHGAPLERGGAWVDLLLGASAYSAPFARLGRLRSAGINDLRHGTVIDDGHAHPKGSHAALHDRRSAVPLPAGVAAYAIAASLGQRAGDGRDRVLGDGLVPVASALGRHARRMHRLAIPPARTRVLYGRGHLDLLSDAAVIEQVDAWLRQAMAETPRDAMS